jgi:NAD(P)-dependent dehydrogenase (short-subunit alcohol dehydrogenase family)
VEPARQPLSVHVMLGNDSHAAWTDGIGYAAARVLLADGHHVLVHERSRERGEPIAKALGGDVVCDLARIDDVRRWADQAVSTARSTGGCTTRAYGCRQHAADSHETTVAPNVLAPHLLTHLLSAELQARLLWLGSRPV